MAEIGIEDLRPGDAIEARRIVWTIPAQGVIKLDDGSTLFVPQGQKFAVNYGMAETFLKARH